MLQQIFFFLNKHKTTISFQWNYKAANIFTWKIKENQNSRSSRHLRNQKHPAKSPFLPNQQQNYPSSSFPNCCLNYCFLVYCFLVFCSIMCKLSTQSSSLSLSNHHSKNFPLMTKTIFFFVEKWSEPSFLRQQAPTE